MNCGCTLTLYHPQCAIGGELFATIDQSQQAFQTASGERRETAWEALAQARIAYTDHVHGWRQGDMRIRQEGGRWRLERRHQEQWIFQVSMTGEETLRVWLKGHRFWRYAQIDGGEPQDRLTGYYHQRNAPASQIRIDGVNTPFPTGPGEQEMQRHVPQSAHAEVDQKTEMALLIAVLVGRFARPLTVVDRLSLQRKAVHWLLSRGGMQQIEAGEWHVIDLLIEQAIAIRKQLDAARNTTLHEQQR
jgi:hypothetical protein